MKTERDTVLLIQCNSNVKLYTAYITAAAKKLAASGLTPER